MTKNLILIPLPPTKRIVLQFTSDFIMKYFIVHSATSSSPPSVQRLGRISDVQIFPLLDRGDCTYPLDVHPEEHDLHYCGFSTIPSTCS